MHKDTAKTATDGQDQTKAQSDKKPPGPALSALLEELNRPLDDIDWSRPALSQDRRADPKTKPQAPRTQGDRQTSAAAAKEAGTSVRKSGFAASLRRQRHHRRELRRARAAASRAFGVRPKLSTRKRATLMLGAGALGLTAFTGPAKPRKAVDFSQVEVVADAYDIDVRKPAILLKASDTFKQALIEEEGVRDVVYRDVAGYPTVGVGHLVLPEDGLRVGDRISQEQVLAFLENDLAEAEAGVRQLVGDLPLRQHEFDALLDLVYNVGIGNVSESESPRLNAAIQAGDYQAIADELDYTHAGGQFARGLKFRSERRAKIFLEAAYDDPREARTSNSA